MNQNKTNEMQITDGFEDIRYRLEEVLIAIGNYLACNNKTEGIYKNIDILRSQNAIENLESIREIFVDVTHALQQCYEYDENDNEDDNIYKGETNERTN